MSQDFWLYRWIAIIWGAVVVWWIGLPYHEQTLWIMMGADLFVGAIAAGAEFRARKLLYGILKKMATWVVLQACYRLQVPGHPEIAEALLPWLFIVYEFASVLENYGKFGRVPPFLPKLLERIRTFIEGAERTDAVGRKLN